MRDLRAVYLSGMHVRSPGLGYPVAALANDVAREPPGREVRARYATGVRRPIEILAASLPADKRGERALANLATIVLARARDDDPFTEAMLQAAADACSGRFAAAGSDT